MIRTLPDILRALIICSAVMLLIVQYSHAQQMESVRGTVIDEISGEPVPDALLMVMREGVNEESLERRVVTGSDGSFRFELAEGVNYNLAVTHPDFMRNQISINPPVESSLQIPLARAYSFTLGGVISDGITGRKVEAAQIQIISENENVEPERQVGTSTNDDGEFLFGFSFSLPLKLRVTHVSYFPTEREISQQRVTDLDIKISPNVYREEDIIVTADMVSREELERTTTIGRVTTVDVQQLSSFDAFDLISTMREVDIATQSMNMQTINARGFNTGASSRVVQLTDGIDGQAPGLGFPIGNLLGPVDLDIAGMEMMLGPASSTYGPSAMNGVLNVSSRSPFDSQGLSLQVKGGVNDLKLGGSSQFAASGDGMTEMTGRYAAAFNSKFAFKLSGSWLTGTDWEATNYDNIGFGESWETYDDVHGYDGVNVYGDESVSYYPLGVDEDGIPNGTLVGVTRSGYREDDLVNYDIETRKAAGSLHFKPTAGSELIVGGRYGYTNTLYTADSRIRLEDFEIFQGSAEFISQSFFLRTYHTKQNSGNSYDVVFMANQLQESAKSNEDWFRDYRIAFENGIPIRGINPNNLRAARNFANSGVTLLANSSAIPMLVPGTEEFQQEFNRLRSVYDFEDGAGIKDNSALTHVESGYTFEDIFRSADLTAGGSFRFYNLESAGTIFPDTTGNDITNYRYGAYLRGEGSANDGRLNLNGSIRVDVNENFDPAISPQAGLNYRLGEDQYFRASYQYGFRFPSVREQFMNQNLGSGRILGGLRPNLDPYNLEDNAVTEQSLNRFNEAVVDELNAYTLRPGQSITREQAEQLHLGILDNGIIRAESLAGIKPEKTHAFEVGYSNLFSSDFYLDLNYFVSFYTDFIGITRAVKSRTSPSVDLFAAAGQLNNSTQSDRFFYYSNARERVSVHGISFDLRQQAGTFFFGLNGTYTQLVKGADDPLIPGFNTPPFKFNLEWGNRKIAENVGFKMVYRYRSGHSWRSPFLDGELSEYGHFDFQVNSRIPQINSMIKAGFTNMGIRKYSNVFGGPAVGSIIFATFTFNPGML